MQTRLELEPKKLEKPQKPEKTNNFRTLASKHHESLLLNETLTEKRANFTE